MKKSNTFLTALGTLFLCVTTALGATFYVSPTGDDANDGRSPDTAWQSLVRVSQARDDVASGDQILFQRGGVWRGVLRPLSGEPGKPVYYGAYGDGVKPRLYGSRDASGEGDWVEVSPNIWATKEVKPEVLGPVDMNFAGPWSLHREQGASASVASSQADGKTSITLKVDKGGKASNHIQLWGPAVPEDLPQNMMLRFRARCSRATKLDPMRIDLSGHPWTCRVRGSGSFELDTEWQTFEMVMTRTGTLPPETATSQKHVWHASWGLLPDDCTLELELLGVQEVKIDQRLLLSVDVGNIIFDHGNFKKYHRCGMKKWTLDDLKAPGDYYYDAASRRVFLFWDENPAKTCQSIELALRTTIIDQSNVHDVTYENLAIAYGAAHGFGGINTARLLIRHCDLYYIGGGHQHTREDGRPVRFGNAIEFWNSCTDNLVEENRIWEVYDAALTNQGKGSEERPSNQVNITYRRNLIWNSEYSFEYWNRGGETRNILFENNYCFDAGNVWSHSQRPDRNGAHMMFYHNGAETSNFVVRNNVFVSSTEVCLRMENDWRSGLTLENNVYYQAELPIIRYRGKFYGPKEFEQYQRDLGLDAGSRLRKVPHPQHTPKPTT